MENVHDVRKLAEGDGRRGTPDFEKCVAETERLLADEDQRGFYKHLKGTVGLKDQEARSGQFVMAEDGTMLREKAHIRERWGEFFHTLLNQKSPIFLSPRSAPYSHDDRSPYRLTMNQPWTR